MIVIKIDSEDYDLIENDITLLEDSVEVLSSRRFQGEPETVEILVELSKVIIPTLSAIIIKLIDLRKNTSIKYNGIEIKGIDNKSVIPILEDILKKEKD